MEPKIIQGHYEVSDDGETGWAYGGPVVGHQTGAYIKWDFANGDAPEMRVDQYVRIVADEAIYFP